MDALTALAVAPPALRPGTVAEAVEAQFGLRGKLHPLDSERDQADNRPFKNQTEVQT